MDSISFALIFKCGPARVSLGYRSVMITKNWLPLFIFSIGLGMSKAISSSGTLFGKSFKCCMNSRLIRSIACAIPAVIHDCEYIVDCVMPKYRVWHDVVHAAFCGLSDQSLVVISM